MRLTKAVGAGRAGTGIARLALGDDEPGEAATTSVVATVARMPTATPMRLIMVETLGGALETCMRATRTNLTRLSWNAGSRNPAITARRLDEHLPVVEAEESRAVGADSSCIPEHRINVRARRVVVMKCKSQISGCARCVQVVRRAEDRVVRVVHVSAEPVAAAC